MHYLARTVLFGLLLVLPGSVLADEAPPLLEAAAQQDDHLQPGLKSYIVTVETGKIAEMIDRMTANMPPDIPRPKPPTITKYWLRGAPKSLIIAEGERTPYVEQMVDRFSSQLAVELDGLLLPADRLAERRELLQKATVKSTEVALADSLLQRIEIVFAEPTELAGAFYQTGIRLPQKEIISLTFDIDVKTQTISEMVITTAAHLQLTAELRYREVPGGYLPQRVQVTNPDGSIDDLLEVTFTEVKSYLLPASMSRIIRRPELQDEFEVQFTGYRVNVPLPDPIRQQMTVGH